MTALMHRTATHRVLEIPEIVELVCSFLDEDTNKTNVAINKRWSEIVMNSLWRDVSEPRRLFTLLSPMRRTYPQRNTCSFKDAWVFEKAPGVDDWSRFTRYARRVRSLTLDERDASDMISSDVFDEMSRSRVTLNVLPNLHSLVWLTESVERMRFSLLFQHENITRFAIYLHETKDYPLSTFFQEVLLRMPHLTHLDLRFEFSAREVEDSLITLFGGLAQLKKVVLPVYTLTSRIMSQLSKSQYLHTIQFEYMEQQGCGDLTDVEADWNPQLAEGAFPALWDLSLSVELPAMTKFIGGAFSPLNLRSLYIQALAAPPLETISHFLDVLSVKCKLLTHLYLDFFASSDIHPSPEQWPRVNWETLRPLLSFPHLVSLEMRWDRPLDISLDDIEEMASKWPLLETLLLNCEPQYNTIPPSLDLRALLPFARHCPRLVELGLYLVASHDVPIPTLDHQMKSFQSLRKICVGLSRIINAGHVAMFLSQICPPGCEITAGVTWPEGYGAVETTDNAETLERSAEEARESFEKWAEVANMLPLLTKLRMDERATRDSLEKEVEDLRIRCCLLAERANVKIDPNGSCVPF